MDRLGGADLQECHRSSTMYGGQLNSDNLSIAFEFGFVVLKLDSSFLIYIRRLAFRFTLFPFRFIVFEFGLGLLGSSFLI